MFQGSYQAQRIMHWWRGDDLQGISYQQYMAKLALGSGGLHGLGLGNSLMKMAYLPEAHTDSIFPIIALQAYACAVDNLVVPSGPREQATPGTLCQQNIGPQVHVPGAKLFKHSILCS